LFDSLSPRIGQLGAHRRRRVSPTAVEGLPMISRPTTNVRTEPFLDQNPVTPASQLPTLNKSSSDNGLLVTNSELSPLSSKVNRPPDGLIPVRMLNEFTYCPRLGYLEFVQGEWAENIETMQGTFGHRHVDKPDRKQVQ